MTPDLKSGDQKTNLEIVEYVRGVFDAFGIHTQILVNPTFPHGSEFIEITFDNYAEFNTGEFIFALQHGSVRVNADMVYKTISNQSFPMTMRMDRLMAEFKLPDWRTLPVISKAIEITLKNMIESQ